MRLRADCQQHSCGNVVWLQHLIPAAHLLTRAQLFSSACQQGAVPCTSSETLCSISISDLLCHVLVDQIRVHNSCSIHRLYQPEAMEYVAVSLQLTVHSHMLAAGVRAAEHINPDLG